jgi:hypothetical protein
LNYFTPRCDLFSVIQSHQDVNKAAVGQLQDKSVTGRAVTLSLRKTRPKRTRRFVGSQSLVDTLVIHTTHLIGVQNSVGTLVSREPGLIGENVNKKFISVPVAPQPALGQSYVNRGWKGETTAVNRARNELRGPGFIEVPEATKLALT